MHSWWCECKACEPERREELDAYLKLSARYRPGGDLYERDKKMKEGEDPG